MPGRAVAIVDDDEEVRDALRELLEVTGFPCRTFDSAVAFLADYTPDQFGCLISDIKMPGMSGLDLQDKLNALGSTMPVIILTSAIDAQTRRRALEAGAHAFLPKPVSENEILSQLQSALGL